MAATDKAKAKPEVTEKAKCPVNLKTFMEKAKPITIKIGDTNTLVASPKQFTTGSFGFYAGDKVVIEVDGVPVKCQLGLNIIAVGSKEAK